MPGRPFNPDESQAEILRSDKKTIILNCHRQYGKSTVAAVKAAHRVRYRSNQLVLLLSPSQRQSIELFRKIRPLVEDLEKTQDNLLSFELKNGSRVVALPSNEENIRGFSAPSLVIIDEASRVDDELYYAALPMLAVSDGQLLLMSTPCGQRGFFYKEWIGEGEWLRIQRVVTECVRIRSEFVAAERIRLPDYMFRQEYLAEFVDSEDALFKTDLIMSALEDLSPLIDVSDEAIKVEGELLDVEPVFDRRRLGAIERLHRHLDHRDNSDLEGTEAWHTRTD